MEDSIHLPPTVRNRPRLRTLGPDEGERHASWLELFFDLVFVLAVAKVAQILVANSDAMGFAKYVAIFAPVWYLWVGFTYYADRFETDEASYRILMFAGMLAVLGLSLTLDGAFTIAGDTAFSVCYVMVVGILAALYGRAAYWIPLARAYCLQFVLGLSGAATLMLVSLAVAPNLRYSLWAAAFALQLAIPFLNVRLTRLIPIDRSHIPERFGLFTIIVLGEAVIATASGASDVAWNASTLLTASMGFAMAACIWWINFEFVEDNAIRSTSLVPRFIFLYGHFLIVATIVAMGVGVEHAIKEANESHLHLSSLLLICGGVAVYLTAITVIRLVTGVCNLVKWRIIAIALSLGILGIGLLIPPVATIGALLALLLGSIWIEGRFSEEHEEKEDEAVPHLVPCEHAGEMKVFAARSPDGCEECRKNNYKWVHLRLCLSCGHVGCCDSSVHKHATKHFHKTGHPIMASLEQGERWAWCYEDVRFVPVTHHIEPLALSKGIDMPADGVPRQIP